MLGALQAELMQLKSEFEGTTDDQGCKVRTFKPPRKESMDLESLHYLSNADQEMVSQIIKTARGYGTTDNEGIALMSESCCTDNDFSQLLNGLNNNLIEKIQDRIDEMDQSLE